MDKDDEDKQTQKPERQTSARRGGRRKHGDDKTGADISQTAKSSDVEASTGKASPKTTAGDFAGAKALTDKAANAAKETRGTKAGKGGKAGKATQKAAAAGASAEAHGDPRIRSEADPRLSRSLEFGVAILESFSGARQTLGIADIAKLVGVSRSTTHRYAMTLVALGYLEQNSKRKYRLARHAADPGGAVIGAIRRELAARAVLEELREQTGHTVSMGVLNGARVIYVHRLLAHGVGQYSSDHDLGVGAGIPAYCSALGKILLASISEAERRELLAKMKLEPHGPNTIEERDDLAMELDRISIRGVVVSDEELFAGSRSIAALVPRPRSEHPAAIEVTVPSSAYTVEQLRKRVGPRLKRAAKLISGD